jgi:hypothetical protein
VGLHGCLKNSMSWFNSRSLDHSRQLEKNVGPIVHGDLENSFIGRRGSNPLSRQLENSVSHNLSKAVLGNGPIGRPAAFEAVHRVGSIPTSPAKAFEPKHHGYLSIGAETCGAKARDVAGSNPALRWPRREHHLFEARCFRNAVGSGVSGNARDSDSRVQGSSPCFPSRKFLFRSCRPMVHDT